MKAQILKIAGVKSEKEFYKKFPSEAAFMKKHGKEFKKAQMGTNIGSYTGGTITPIQNIDLSKIQDDTILAITGKTRKMLDQEAKDASAQNSASQNSGGGFGDIMGMLGGGDGMGSIMGMFGAAKQGADIPRAQFGNNAWANSGNQYYNSNLAGMSGQPPIGSLTAGTMMSNQQTANQPIASGGSVNTGAKQKGGFDGMKSIPILGGILGAIGGFAEQTAAKQAAEQASLVAGLSEKASATLEEETKRRYNTPWDNVQTGEALSPVLGGGTNPLTKNGGKIKSAKNGKLVGGNPTEIQNTYSDGYDIYTDGGYEPYKAAGGGTFNGSQWGVLSKGGAGFGENPYGGMVSGMFGDDAGGQLGGSIGSIFGPVGGIIGQGIGSILDTDAEETNKFNKQTQRSMDTVFANKFAKVSRAGHAGYRKNGGYVNPEYNPQVITMFGDHTSEDFADYANKDQYRAGGHLQSYTPPSERAMQTYAMGGDINSDQVGDVTIESGGYLEPISWNPHTGGTGFTSKFHGQSHVQKSPGLDHTGIIMRYGGNTGEQDGDYQMAEGGDTGGNVIEAERGEYIREVKDGGEVEESAQISGNRRYNSKLYDLGPAFNKEFEGKKIKAIQGIVAAADAKLNKFDDRNTDELLAFEPITQIDKLKQNALIANQKGIDMQYGINAAKVDNALAWQNSANEVIDEASSYHGKEINGDDFVNSAGKKINFTKEPLDSSKSKNGSVIEKAQYGKKITKKERDAYIAQGYKPDPKNPNRLILKTDAVTTTTPETTKIIPGVKGSGASASTKDARPGGKAAEPWKRKMIAELNRGVTYEELAKKGHGTLAGLKKMFPNEYRPLTGSVDVPERIEKIPGTTVTTPGKTEEVTVKNDSTPVEGKSRFPWEVPVNALIDYFRPSDAEAFDYSQLYPEMYAMADNQLEPVPAQGYQPDLDTPYDISLQDQLNANQADFNALQRNVGYNPAAQSALAAQKYAANSKILGEQFRLNQAQKAGVYGSNRDKLNQAKLTNLGIYDKQYERQAEAKSNTKATALAALNSMTDKLAKHKLENKTLAVYENMYNYRFGKSGKAKNWNGLQFFDTTVSGAKGKSGIPEGYKAKNYDANGNPTTLELITPEEKAQAMKDAGGISMLSKNGAAVKKNYKNSSVVRAFKNL